MLDTLLITLATQTQVTLPPPQTAARAGTGRRSISFVGYAVWSCAIVSAALAVAVSVSAGALAYAEANAGPPRTAEVASFIGPEVSSAFVEALNTRHEGPPPFPFSLAAARAQTDYIVSGRIVNVNVTFYDCANQGFCGAMYNGRQVYEGAAACSWNLAIGTKFVIIGDPTHRVYICEDRGLLPNTWVDIFFYYPADGYHWQGMVGRYGTIEIVH